MTDTFGPKPDFAWLPVVELHVDSSYQRSIEARRNQAAIERICEGFRWSLFGVVTVTKGLTDYLIIDGQHRTEAARRLKIETVPCLVVPAISRKDQALAFVSANRDRVPVSQFAIHHALAAAGDEHASALERLCAAAGIEIPRYPIPSISMKPGQTLAIGALSSILDGRGLDRAAVLLTAIRQAFPNERAALRAPIISAVSYLDEHRGGIDAEAMRRALARVGLKAFEKECALLLIDGAVTRNRMSAAVTVIERLMGGSAPAAQRIETQRETEKPSTPPLVARTAPAPNVAPKPQVPTAAKRPAASPAPVKPNLSVHAEQPASSVLVQAVQRRCQGCRSIFKTKLVSEVLCPTCTVGSYRAGAAAEARARR